MYKILVIEITIVLQILARVTNKTYDDLVKENGEIYKKVNKAIDESIIALQKNNDTEIILGLQYMRQLKKQLKEINGTDPSNTIARRSRPKLTLNVKELADLLSKKYILHKEKVSEEQQTNSIDTDRIELLERFAGWEKKWKLEKAKGVATSGDMTEKCPRYGYSNDNSTVRKGTTSEYPDTALETSLEEEEENAKTEKNQTKKDGRNGQDQAKDGKNGKDQVEDDKNGQDQPEKGEKEKEKDENEQEKKKKKKVKWNKGLRYPCCRKCCKASDMGCL